MRRLGRGANVALRSREALGIRPAPKGVCHRSWLDGDRHAARNRRGLATSPEARTKVLKRRGGAPRGVAVCLCFPAIREIRRGRYQVAPFGASPPSPSRRARTLNLPLT